MSPDVYVTVEFDRRGKICTLNGHLITFLNVLTVWIDTTTDRLKFIANAGYN